MDLFAFVYTQTSNLTSTFVEDAVLFLLCISGFFIKKKSDIHMCVDLFMGLFSVYPIQCSLTSYINVAKFSF